MQNTVKRATKPGEKPTKIKEKTSKEELLNASKKSQEDKLKKPIYNLSTPRNYVPKSSTADVYSQANKNPITIARAPKKVKGLTSSVSRNATPMMKDLKSSPSSISQISAKMTEKKPKIPSTSTIKKVDEAKNILSTARKTDGKSGKDLPFVNVTVNSPPVKRKLEFEKEKRLTKEIQKGERERKKTRTLTDDEVKVLKSETVVNNVEMQNLSRKLSAKPKAFFVDLDGEEKPKPKTSKPDPSSEEYSYEDDFESYESDFDSYRSSSSPGDDNDDEDGEDKSEGDHENETSKREGRDEENMLDSGSFELREAHRSAHKSRPTVMEYIVEDAASVDKKTSLTDEGFQDMSSSSGLSSMRTVSHVDVLDRPLFIDFKKSKESKRRRLTFERLQQRAKDLLSMITLHEMSYTLFEMKPIPYDVYMATFGRNNYTQSGVQTFEDGITEEVQTDEVFCSDKWTQFPVKFSKDEVHLRKETYREKRSKNDVDYLKKFTFLLNSKEVDVEEQKNFDDDYKVNPLRIYFEQKDGVGTDEMLPYRIYETKLKNTDHNASRLKHFLKKIEGKVSNILSVNAGNTGLLDLTKNSELPFSKGYVSLEYKNLPEFKFLKYRKVTDIVFSDTKSNLLMTVHKSRNSVSMYKSLVCLWDLSVASRRPVKILVAIDNLSLCRFRGSTDGVFVAALEDCSIHLWDLSEDPHIVKPVSLNLPPDLRESDTVGMTQTEIDREWNLRHSNVSYDTEEILQPLQACAYTSSARSLLTRDTVDSVVGLQLLGDGKQDGGRRVLGQVCSLQRIGILTIWSIIQERSKTIESDIGKAYWSKMKLERNYTITLADFIDSPVSCLENPENCFNLTAAKRRLASKKSSSKFENSRPLSVASGVRKKKVLPVNRESDMLCTDLKVLKCGENNNYLVSKNCGEVLCCTRTAGVVKVLRFCVTTDKSSITRLSVSPHGVPYFLAASDAGSLHLCSLLEYRVVLTLDCARTATPPDYRHKSPSERSVGDYKGRYLGTVPVRPAVVDAGDALFTQAAAITSLVWCSHDPCRIITLRARGALSAWDLATSDIYPTSTGNDVAATCTAGGALLALLTPEGEIQLHTLFAEQENAKYLELFNKYVALL